MHLQLSGPPGQFEDGSTSWNASAANALAIWNQHVDQVRLVPAGPGAIGDGNHVSTVVFANSVYGENFGTNVLAVTLYYSATDSGVFTEADVLFNNTVNYSSYRGPFRQVGGNYSYDFHRVALHEFGHVLGLDHPDENRQYVPAIMNSIIGELDHLVADDIAGAEFLYRNAPANAPTGIPFEYHVVLTGHPTSYAAVGLPPGLILDRNTGVISGVPTISGTYQVRIGASSPTRTTAFTLTITVAPAPGPLLAKFDLAVARLAVDPVRPRVYATMSEAGSVVVIDVNSLSIVKRIPIGRNPSGLAISADGSKLWVANFTDRTIGVVDLESLTTLPSLPTPTYPVELAEGLDHRLYVSAHTAGVLMQIDTQSGAVRAYYNRLGPLLAISPDRKTLYAGNQGISPAGLIKMDVSTVNASVIQESTHGAVGSSGHDLTLTHDGAFLCFSAVSDYGVIRKIPTSNLDSAVGVFEIGFNPGLVAFSGDGSLLYAITWGVVDIFNAYTFNLVDSIPLNPERSVAAGDMAVDNTGALLFVAVSDSLGRELRVFETHRRNRVGSTAPPKSLLNVSTRLRAQGGDNVLIGGFIITGTERKKVLLRALGPSLSVPGALADPRLELHAADGRLIAFNDNWNSHRLEVLASTIPPGDEHEAALVATLPPGAYTAIVQGVGGASGIASVEVYDLDPGSDSRIGNISTRGKVETGDNVMIGGFIISADQPTKVIVRALGPSLATHNVAGSLANTTLDLHDRNGTVLASNDDWSSDQAAEIIASHVPPTDPRESAIVLTLPPGNYTAVVRGKNSTRGVALVEVYNLEP